MIYLNLSPTWTLLVITLIPFLLYIQYWTKFAHAFVTRSFFFVIVKQPFIDHFNTKQKTVAWCNEQSRFLKGTSTCIFELFVDYRTIIYKTYQQTDSSHVLWIIFVVYPTQVFLIKLINKGVCWYEIQLLLVFSQKLKMIVKLSPYETWILWKLDVIKNRIFIGNFHITFFCLGISICLMLILRT